MSDVNRLNEEGDCAYQVALFTFQPPNIVYTLKQMTDPDIAAIEPSLNLLEWHVNQCQKMNNEEGVESANSLIKSRLAKLDTYDRINDFLLEISEKQNPLEKEMNRAEDLLLELTERYDFHCSHRAGVRCRRCKFLKVPLRTGQ